MMSNYTIKEKIYQFADAKVYSTHEKNPSNTPINIITIPVTIQSSEDKAHFIHEFNQLKNFNHEGIVDYKEFIEEPESLSVIYKKTDYMPISKLIKTKKINLNTFLQFSISISKILGDLHINNITHRYLTCRNVLYDIESNKVVLNNFGFIHDFANIRNSLMTIPDIRYLQYCSPEQTGRINGTVDYRSDLYSLGIIFYNILTGRLPFYSNDPLELIHSQIAKKAPEVNSVNSSIPVVISNIVDKLLAKKPEDRYQNCFSLMRDLLKCQEMLIQKKIIEEFPIAENDISFKFILPNRVFGRKKEIESILNSFNKAAQKGKEIVLVSGQAGIGKSALINEIYRPITYNKGLFISGKFEQFKKGIPYSAIIQALKDLTKIILSDNSKNIQIWKEKILTALHPNAKVITDVIPDIRLIIGDPPDVPELSSEESENRFTIAFKKFVQTIASKGNPIALFLDDLQWIDNGSLKLLKNIIKDPDIEYILLLGAYRSTDVRVIDHINDMINDIEKFDISCSAIELKELEIDAIEELTSFFLGIPNENVKELSKVILNKTKGNPFFINQFLKTLHDEGALTQDFQAGWKYHEDKLNSFKMTDNVIDMMKKKLLDLPHESIELLKICSCIGNKFKLKMLFTVTGTPMNTILERLRPVIFESLIVYRDSQYEFQHDKVQEAVYALLSPSERKELHLKIGKLFLKSLENSEYNDNVISIANQFNKGIDLIKDIGGILQLIEINLDAALKAKSSSAYNAALSYLQVAIREIKLYSSKDDNDLGVTSFWKNYYELTLKIYIEAAETAYLCTEYDLLETYSKEVFENAITEIDKIPIYEIQIQTFMAQNRLEEAVDKGLLALKILGVNIPKYPNKYHLVKELIKTKTALSFSGKNKFYTIKEVEDLRIIYAIRIVTTVASVVYWVVPDVLPLLIFKTILLTLKYGICSSSCIGIASYGMILSSIGQMEEGYKFAQLGYDLIQKRNFEDQEPRTLFVMNTFVLHWTRHASEALPTSISGYEKSLALGNLEFAAHFLMIYSHHLFLTGQNLQYSDKEITKSLKNIKNLKQQTSLQITKIYHQTVLNLIDPKTQSCNLIGDSYNENIMISAHHEASDQTALFTLHCYKMIISYIFDKYDIAYENSIQAVKYIDAVHSTFDIPAYYYFSALVLIKKYKTDKPKNQYLKDIKKKYNKYKKWAHHSPDNFLHRKLHLQAELEIIKGNHKKTIDLYHEATDQCLKNKYNQDLGVILESAANYYFEIGYMDFYESTLKKSYSAFSKWGSIAKLNLMKKKYSSIAFHQANIENNDTTPKNNTLIPTINLYDYLSIVKASQTLSREILLPELLKKMMNISIENAGAEKGFLILQKEGELTIEAAGFVDTQKTEILKSIPVENFDEIPKTIINYVAHTGEIVLLSDASSDSTFSSDEYLINKKPKSILCEPIISMGNNIGVLYLENNLSTGVFRHERIEILSILANQAAISIENAALYKNLENLVNERTKELNSAMSQLESVNKNLSKTNQELITAQKVADESMEMAINVQTKFLPDIRDIASWDIASYYKPMTGISGDFYDFYVDENNLMGVSIFDVSGHGIASALITLLARSILFRNFMSNSEKTLGEILRLANNDLINELSNVDQYITGIMLRFNEKDIEYVNAGHNKLIIRKGNNKGTSKNYFLQH